MEVTPLIIEAIECIGVRPQVLVNIVVNPRAGKIAATLYRKIGVATQEHVVDCREVALSQCVYSSALPMSARADEIVVDDTVSCDAPILSPNMQTVVMVRIGSGVPLHIVMDVVVVYRKTRVRPLRTEGKAVIYVVNI